MKILILGGGIAAISLAKFLQNKKEIEEITILEKDDKIGGLLRSYRVNNIFYDVGPHIIFSRDKKILNLILKTLGKNKNKIRRSNKILYDKNTQRTRVPAQSVAFAAAQMAIYPFETSGGWNILGTTPYQFFDPNKNPPVIVKAGDRLRFYEIDESHFKALQLIWETSSDREKLLSHVC